MLVHSQTGFTVGPRLDGSAINNQTQVLRLPPNYQCGRDYAYTQHQGGKRDPGWPPTPIANDQLHQRGDYDYAYESTEGYQSGCPATIPQEPFAGSYRSADLNQPLVGDSDHGESNVETQEGMRRGQVEAAQHYHESPNDEYYPGSHAVDQIAAERSKSSA